MLLKLKSLYQKREFKHKRGQLNETPLRESAGKVIKVSSLEPFLCFLVGSVLEYWETEKIAGNVIM